MTGLAVIFFLISLVGAAVSLILIIVKAVKKQPKKKVGLALAVCFALFVISIIIMPKQAEEPTQAETPAQKETPVQAETTVQTEEPLQEEINGDLEIIVRQGHPTYYGSVEVSHTIWNDVPKGKIVFADSFDKYNDDTILSMSAYRNSDMIRSIGIYFANFEQVADIDVETALHIASSYMPYEVMDKYYEYKGSERIVPNETKKEGFTYYVVSYRLTEDGSKAYYAKEHEYSGTIDVIIQVDKGIVHSINISFGTPRWMSSLSQNNYNREEWSCNLYDYR